MAVLLVVAACGTQDPTATPSAPVAGTTSTPAQRPVFDPARTFSSEGVRLPPAVTSDVRDSTSKTVAAPHVLLRGRTAWAATSDALLAFDAESGETRAEIRPERASTEVVSDGTRTDLEPPRVVAVSGRALVVQTFAVTVEGRGTTAARAAIEVVAADADAAGLAWRQVVDVPAGFEVPDGSVLRTAVVGVDGSTAVVRLATGNSRTGDGSVGTLAVDLAAREAAWVQSGLDPLAVVGGLVAGLLDDPRDQALQARRVADGSTVWSKDVEAAQAVPAGPELLLVHGLRGREFGAVTGVRVVDGGEVDVRLPAKARGLPRYCAHDGRSVAVCVNSTVFGLDPASGEVLWSLADDPDRLPLRVTGAWHGLVYGDTGRNGPVVLDARTGEDVGTSPGAAPYWTDGRYAVTDDEVVPVTG